MSYHYEIYTTILGNFDPEVMGVTLVSIIETCNWYVNHSVPLTRGDVMIKMETSKPLDKKYLIDQLNDNFQVMGEPSVVKKVIRKSL